ncbi:MAG: LPS assembly protein LptD [Proteobacteria bacterium]|nr:LPS assembly protein LptD [Pseudomonadota bacterium]
MNPFSVKRFRKDVYTPFHAHRSYHEPCRGLLFFLVLFYISVISTPSFSLDDASSEGPWHIVADSLSYDNQTKIYTAEGGVMVTRDNETISSDFLEYDRMLGAAFARGNVVMTSRDGDRSSAERLLLDLNTKQGTLYNGSIFIESNHIYIKGREIRKIGESTYTADKVSITSCDGDSPAWKFTGHDLTVTIEGYGTVFNAAFWAKKMPLLYSPYLVFPVKIKRQTGLLPPEVAQSDRKGTEYLQPFFWAINDSSDATFYTRFMTERGNMVGAEYRYVLSNESKGTMMADYLDDKQIDDGSIESTDLWGYDDSINRSSPKRYWIRTKLDQSMPAGATLKIDTDIVSDQDYLREFSSMKNGFDSSKRYFTGNYGRDLEAIDDYVRTNSIIYTKNWPSYSLNASAYWYDNVVNRRLESDDTTLQKLPTLDFIASRHRILNSPFYYDLDSEYSYFFRQDTTEALRKGQRADVYPRLILPFRAKNWFSLESMVGVHNTYWYIENETLTSDDLNGSHERQIYDLSVDLSTDFYRIFNTGGETIDRIKHNITPKLIYAYTPDRDQDDLPNYFDALDRLNRVNTLTFSLNNTLTSRSRLKTSDDTPQVALAPPKYSYSQFCRFKLEQVYDMNEAQETDMARFRNFLTKEPFLPLYGELEFLPYDFMRLEANARWSHYDRHLTEGNVIFSVNDQRGDTFSLEQRYTYNSVKYLKTHMVITLTDSLSVYGENERNLLEREDLRSSAGLIYLAQCWGIQFDYTHKPGDKRYSMMFSLSGLGEFGSSISADQTP